GSQLVLATSVSFQLFGVFVVTRHVRSWPGALVFLLAAIETSALLTITAPINAANRVIFIISLHVQVVPLDAKTEGQVDCSRAAGFVGIFFARTIEKIKLLLNKPSTQSSRCSNAGNYYHDIAMRVGHPCYLSMAFRTGFIC